MIGAAVGGLAGAVWADRNNDGGVDGYVYNGQYYAGAPPAIRRLRSGSGSDAGSGADAQRRTRLNRPPSKRVFDGKSIGECVNSLRDQCTGRRPVHFFRKTLRVAAALMLAAMPTAAVAAAAPPRRPAQRRRVRRASTISTAARNNYPLWLAPNAGDAAQQLMNLLVERQPRRPRSQQISCRRAAAGARRGAQRQAQAGRGSRPSSCPMRSSPMSRT